MKRQLVKIKDINTERTEGYVKIITEDFLSLERIKGLRTRAMTTRCPPLARQPVPSFCKGSRLYIPSLLNGKKYPTRFRWSGRDDIQLSFHETQPVGQRSLFSISRQQLIIFLAPRTTTLTGRNKIARSAGYLATNRTGGGARPAGARE